MKRFLSFVLSLVVVSLACSVQAQTQTRTSTKALDRVAAVVNDEIITGSELQARIELAVRQLRRQNIALPPESVLTRQVLELMIVERAQLQLAKETGVRVDDSTVNAALGRIAEQNNMALPQFRERVEREGISFARYREQIREEITMARLREREVEGRIQISEGEVDNFLAEQANASETAAEFNVAQILLRTPENASAEAIDSVRKRAEDILAQAKSGTDFARLAASYSNSQDALQGGELGWRSAERLPSLFLDAVKNLKQGDLGPIVRSPAGFHVLKLLGRRSGGDNRLSNTPVEQTRARHILLRVSDINPEPEVKRRLTELRDRVLKGGQDFGQMARLHSVDGSATRGGDLGWVNPGDMVPEFERAMNELKANEVSEPVQSPFGWHLIQVLERRTEQSPLERNRFAARQALRDRKFEQQYQDWLRQLRDRTYVEMRLEDS